MELKPTMTVIIDSTDHETYPYFYDRDQEVTGITRQALQEFTKFIRQECFWEPEDEVVYIAYKYIREVEFGEEKEQFPSQVLVIHDIRRNWEGGDKPDLENVKKAWDKLETLKKFIVLDLIN